MRTEPYDVGVVGAGAVGVAAAQEIAARGHSVVLLDRCHPHPDCLKAEKIDGNSIDYLRRLGFEHVLKDLLTPVWRTEVFFGERLVDRTRDNPPEWSAGYHDLVNRLRDGLDARIEFRAEKIAAIRPACDHVRLVTRDGELHCKLVVLTTGSDSALARQLGLQRRAYWPGSSVTVGFSLGRRLAEFPALPLRRIHVPLAGAELADPLCELLQDGLAAKVEYVPGAGPAKRASSRASARSDRLLVAAQPNGSRGARSVRAGIARGGAQGALHRTGSAGARSHRLPRRRASDS